MAFTKINSKVVRVDLMQSGPIVARRGAMLFYTGEVQFAPHGSPGGAGGAPGLGGMAGMAGRMLQGEHEATMLAQGKGSVHYGFKGLETHVVDMSAGGELRVEASRMLAHTVGLQSSVVSANATPSGGGGGGGLFGALRGAATGMVTGQGMFTTQLSGYGAAVLLAHGGVLELQVGGPSPVVVDPQAFVASYGPVRTELKSSMTWRNAGRTGGESMQLECTGQGIVYVQASEEKL
ncbi:AIM24 family protein [Rhodococcus sp. HNM0563]|uniref:AIM24 family protein n=1 Tax=unclassified Rhodococcus (in: high G+C Gram-positive bacteria) TaxID=192944 RepID=UPI00146B639E|nr:MULTISPECIES: AIM24 family protein [unclassified Rhodococcus (in: high G+C Gram-positive bacteria)]MCK0091628.1 AIM24 family protein [Rhodococcus sp. F64268]NLU63944.1 AIM24 family protein [Rhodococcus sp. HNM0563]